MLWTRVSSLSLYFDWLLTGVSTAFILCVASNTGNDSWWEHLKDIFYIIHSCEHQYGLLFSLVGKGVMSQHKTKHTDASSTVRAVERFCLMGFLYFAFSGASHTVPEHLFDQPPVAWRCSQLRPERAEGGLRLDMIVPFWTDRDISALTKSCARQLKRTVPSPLLTLISFSTRLSSPLDWCSFFRLTDQIAGLPGGTKAD